LSWVFNVWNLPWFAGYSIWFTTTWVSDALTWVFNIWNLPWFTGNYNWLSNTILSIFIKDETFFTTFIQTWIRNTSARIFRILDLTCVTNYWSINALLFIL
jgi:hypothetical protein